MEVPSRNKAFPQSMHANYASILVDSAQLARLFKLSWIGKTMPELATIQDEWEGKSAEEILRWSAQRFGDKIVLSTSFGAEDMVLLDMVSRIDPKVRIFTLDTGRLPKETYQVMSEARVRYGLPIQVFFPDTTRVEEMVTAHGPDLFYESVANRQLCCHVRKVEPLKRAMMEAQAWITGLRREQAASRSLVRKVAEDETRAGVTKICPLADWSEEQVWAYIRKWNVPYNALHDQGYPSIGCAPCTRAIKPGEDKRAGRWWWENGTKECGLHEHHPVAGAKV